MNHRDIFVVVDANDFELPLGMCDTLDKAIDVAEELIARKWRGKRHQKDDDTVALVEIYKTAMNCLIDVDAVPEECWNSLVE